MGLEHKRGTRVDMFGRRHSVDMFSFTADIHSGISRHVETVALLERVRH